MVYHISYELLKVYALFSSKFIMYNDMYILNKKPLM